ncbi:hypothetical protein BKA66DRAFT_432817 [Pyrenochaeta sp. MPI-SDFR-AT-0127]|nr:hypothetical protein BKA66DRAFT_432817 [Pyrenochaeta sp. MPI-SDFR-AT-0127]
MPSILTTAVAVLAAAPVAFGHTWIEQLRNINEQGEYVGEYGYPRGMVSKTDPGFNGFSMNIELPAYQGRVYINEDTPLCHPSQTKQVQSQDKYPRLQAVPGGFIAMRYQENGHVTKPDNQKGKPEKGGTIFVYGTTEPRENEKLVNVLQWTEDGQGGNKRGVLLTTNDFDDGRCYETNETPVSQERRKSDPNFAMGQVVDGVPGNYPLMCETNVQLPKTAALDETYTLYWVWQWNTAPGGVDPGLPEGKDEYYTTCMDVDVASADVAMAADAKQKYALGPQQDAMSVAVADWASRTAIMTDALQGEVGPYFSQKPTGAPSATGGAPSRKPTAPAVTRIPTLTKRPGAAPTPPPSDDNVVTVTDTVVITVTAPAATESPPAAATTRAVYSVRNKNGAKFRGRFAS